MKKKAFLLERTGAMVINQYTLEELVVGQKEILNSDVTCADVEGFALLSGDISPVHTSDEFAQSKGYTNRIAHGLLIGARISALVGNKLPGAYGILQTFDLEFRSPLVPPEQIEIIGEVVNISAGTGQVTLKIQVMNSGGKLIANCKARTIVHKPVPKTNPL